MLGDGRPAPGASAQYLETLERLRPLVAAAEHVVPGHGAVLDREAALRVLDEDVAYLQALRERGAEAELPAGRRTKVQRELHEQNVTRLAALPAGSAFGQVSAHSSSRRATRLRL